QGADNPYPLKGDTVVLTTTLINALLPGTDNATQVVTNVRLPEGLTFVSASPSSGTTYNPATGRWQVPYLSAMADPRATLQLRITATVDRDAPGRDLKATASAHAAQPDRDASDNDAFTTVTIRDLVVD